MHPLDVVKTRWATHLTSYCKFMQYLIFSARLLNGSLQGRHFSPHLPRILLVGICICAVTFQAYQVPQLNMPSQLCNPHLSRPRQMPKDLDILWGMKCIIYLFVPHTVIMLDVWFSSHSYFFFLCSFSTRPRPFSSFREKFLRQTRTWSTFNGLFSVTMSCLCVMQERQQSRAAEWSGASHHSVSASHKQVVGYY